MKYTTTEENEFYTSEKCHIIEIMNTPDQQNVSVARARLEKGITTSVHYLKGTTEYYHILQGKGEVYLDNNAGFEVSVGDVVAINAGQHQSIKNTGDEDLLFICICSPRFRQENYVAVV